MRTWILPQTLLTASISIMAPHGRAGNEGLALWLGREEGDVAHVTHILKLRGSGFVTRPLQLQLSDRAMAKITNVAFDLETFLIGQVHSHPGTFVDLSEVDVIYGIRIEDYLSVVAPHYAQIPTTTWGECGFHVFEGTDYRRLRANEIAARVHWDSKPVEVVDVEVHQ